MSDLLTVDGLPIAPGLRLTIAWIGGLSRLPTSSKDFLVEVALRATGEGAERFLAQVALGDLVYLFPGTTWEQQHRVRLRRRTERQVRLDLSPGHADLQSASFRLESIRTEGPTGAMRAFKSQYFTTRDEDNIELVLPCFEVLRAFYAPSSAFFRLLVSGPTGSDLIRLLTKSEPTATGQSPGLQEDSDGRLRIRLADGLRDTKRNRQIAAHLCRSEAAQREVRAMQVGLAAARQRDQLAVVLHPAIRPPFDGPARWTVRGEWRHRPVSGTPFFHVFQVLDCDFAPAFSELVLDDLPVKPEDPADGGGDAEPGPGGDRKRRRRRKARKLSSRLRPTATRTPVTEFVQNLPVFAGLDARTSVGEAPIVRLPDGGAPAAPRPVTGSTLSPTSTGAGIGVIPVDLQGVPLADGAPAGHRATDWPFEWFIRAFASVGALVATRLNRRRDRPLDVQAFVLGRRSFVDAYGDPSPPTWFFVATEPEEVEREAMIAIVQIGSAVYLLAEVGRRMDMNGPEAYATVLAPAKAHDIEGEVDCLMRDLGETRGHVNIKRRIPSGAWSRLHPPLPAVGGVTVDSARSQRAVDLLAHALASSVTEHWLGQPGNALPPRARTMNPRRS